ncbi:lysophospholipid acyltransferase family protein [Methyloterricola oryzae]|uniref:lysophospholipid acyltransferase family protein n=1 Tax=Methyloterricola oryzae TaxID=1495050 RepID=UPI0005EBB224|nr:lysophospholipid acyltransferase family protein [Methyloterricola oryzae]
MLNRRRVLKAALVALLFVWGLVAVTVVMPISRRVSPRGAQINDRIRQHWCHAVCRVLGVRITSHGSPSDLPGLKVANHISWLDIIVLGSLLPLAFVAKLEVAAWPVLGYLAKRTGTLFIRRGDAEHTAAACEQMAWQLRQGRRVMLFPEGTTTRGERVLRFHAKLLQPAQRAQVPVQAVALRYRNEAATVAPFVDDDAFLPHLIDVLKLQNIDVEVHFCPVLPAGQHRDTLARTTRNQVLAALGETAATATGY